MSRFEFSLAGSGDDAAIRARFAEDWMPGEVSVTFRREPSFFDSLDLLGDSAEVIKCYDQKNGSFVGFGTRYKRKFFYNGERIIGGYLADLRCDPAYRGLGLLARGYKYLHNLHAKNPYQAYYSVIYEGNVKAEQILTSARAGLPQYVDCGLIKTPAIHLDFNLPEFVIPGVVVRPAKSKDLPSIIQFLNRENSKKQFAEVCTFEQLILLSKRGFKIEDMTLAESQGEIIGTAGAFSPVGFRQTHVERYSKKLSFIRPFYNAASFLTPLKPLPKVGNEIPYFYILMPAAKDNDPSIMRALLRHIYRRHRKGPWHYFIAGFHEDDPLATCLDAYRHIPAAGRLYEIIYPESDRSQRQSRAFVPYIEPFSL
jgi:hypothetical protein